MGLVYLLVDDKPIVVAYGGYKKMAKYFHDSYEALVFIAQAMEGTLHFMFMDERAWETFSCYANYFSTR